MADGGEDAEAAPPDWCTHTDEERALEGSWATCELNAAVERGYRVLQVYTGY